MSDEGQIDVEEKEGFENEFSEDLEEVEKTVFKIVFTDGEVKYLKGTNLLNRSTGGVSVIDEERSGESDSHFVVITVPQHTLKYAFSVSDEIEVSREDDKKEDSEVGDSEDEDESVDGEEEDSDSDGLDLFDDGDKNEFWDEDSLWDEGESLRESSEHKLTENNLEEFDEDDTKDEWIEDEDDMNIDKDLKL